MVQNMTSPSAVASEKLDLQLQDLQMPWIFKLRQAVTGDKEVLFWQARDKASASSPHFGLEAEDGDSGTN